jgi:hypothetical protein
LTDLSTTYFSAFLSLTFGVHEGEAAEVKPGNIDTHYRLQVNFS